MARINASQHEKPHSLPHIANMGFDPELQIPLTSVVGYDGSGLTRGLADSLAVKITESGTTSYVALAAPGTLESEAKWQAMKLDESSGLVTTFADGDPNFDNIATDLAALTYS